MVVEGIFTRIDDREPTQMIQDYLPNSESSPLIAPAEFPLSFEVIVMDSGDCCMEILPSWRGCYLSYCDGDGLAVEGKIAESEIIALVR